jgi:transposase InsO family protein
LFINLAFFVLVLLFVSGLARSGALRSPKVAAQGKANGNRLAPYPPSPPVTELLQAAGPLLLRSSGLAHHTWHLRQVEDLASRYKFTPRAGEHVWGETVAVHLEQLFLRHGPPLVLKRDNGSNLNQQAVDEVLARYLVLPLNSPPHYPPCNGGIECAVRELKTPLREKILASAA